MLKRTTKITCEELARNIPGIFKGYSRDLPGSSPKTIQGRCDSSRYVPGIYKFSWNQD